jgi:serine/threonine protein kinase
MVKDRQMLSTRRRNLVEEILWAALDLPEPERQSFLENRCGDDAEILREVQSLAGHMDGAEEFFLSRLPAPVCLEPLRAGDRLGPYRLERLLGAGGMGTVYLAGRDDGQFHQRVAIKLIRNGMESGWAVNRFRHERQVLARLSHPHISRLLDGGSTVEGAPYLVMEYVDGEPLTSYCRERNLSTEARLRLFLKVCDAVSYAHRNLIVHRDIKPGNILVTAEGVPKLLDFGIAKLLEPMGDSAPAAALTTHVLTPEYASPEQVRGEPVTIAADVYSLGAVLGEMLTGLRPSQTKPAARLLPGDLDNIAALATRAEPERRYQSVDQLAEDIRRYLDGRPVTARKDTFFYRAGKFIRRHKAGMAASVLLLISLLGGMAATAWQARLVAEQVARAEKRFLHFRKLANAFLFDLHPRIESLDDPKAAREVIVDAGIEFIDGLAREAEGDPMMMREVARAYEKFGDLAGFRLEGSAGRPHEALKSYRKALAVLEPLDRGGSADREATFLLARTRCSAGEMIELTAGYTSEALLAYEGCLEAAWRAGQPLDRRKEVGQIQRAYLAVGDFRLASGDRAAAFQAYSTILRIVDERRQAFRVEPFIWLANIQRRIGRWHAEGGNAAEALRWFQQAVASARASGEPPRVEIVLAYQDLVRHLTKTADPAASPMARELVSLSRALVAAAPRNFQSRHHLAESLKLAAPYPTGD